MAGNVTAPQFQQDVNNTADWANGGENTTVTMRLGQQADSPAKTIKDIKDAGSEAAGSIQFTVKGAFADGFTIDYYFELGETATGEIYRYKRPNALPFVVPAGFDPTADSRFEQWVNTDHNNLTNRNAVGAHDAASISNSEGGSVQDFISNGIENKTSSVQNLESYTDFISSSRVYPNGKILYFEDLQARFVIGSYTSDPDDYSQIENPITGQICKIQKSLHMQLKSFRANSADDEVVSRKKIQSFFDFCKLNDVKSLTVNSLDSDTVTIDSVGADYDVDDSTITYDAQLKLVSPILKCNRMVNYNANNVVVRKQKIDFDRDNNLVDTVNRGTQFNFTCYGGSNIKFYGGESLNAAQSHLQSTSEGVKIRDYKFKRSGEHSIYLTLNTGSPLEDVEVDKCEFHDWNLDSWDGYAVSCRDYRSANIKNSKFYPNTTGYGHVQFFGEYDSTLPADTYQLFNIDNCEMFYGSALTQSVTCTSKAVNTKVKVNNSLLLGRVPNASIDELNNCTIDLSYIPSEFTRWQSIPLKLLDCTIYTGLAHSRPSNGFTMQGGKVIHKTAPADGTFWNLQSGTLTDPAIISGVEFEGFDAASQSGSILGLIRTKSGIPSIVENNKFYNTDILAIDVRSTTDVIYNNVDVTSSGATIALTATPRLDSGNLLP